jgi:hypothetical protein
MFSTVIDHGASSSLLLCFRGNCWSVQYRYRFRMHDWNLYFVGYLAFSLTAPPRSQYKLYVNAFGREFEHSFFFLRGWG